MGNCTYQERHCTLSTGAQVIWEPNTEEQCQFLSWMNVTGHTYGQFFMAEDKEIAFSLRQAQEATDCEGKAIKIPPQGVPYRHFRP